MAEELLLLSPAQIEAAANVGRLARLAERLVEERSWSSVDMLLSHATLDVVPVEELANAARAVDRALSRVPEARSRRATVMREIAALRALAAKALVRRLKHDPLTTPERALLQLAGELMMSAGEPREAAPLFERAGEDMRAADAYGATGDLERMEACHARIERQRGQRQAVSHLTRKVETLVEAGERGAALSLLQQAPADLLRASGLESVQRDLALRLRRGRTLGIKRRGDPGAGVRFASPPAVLGRDPEAEILLRDLAVSRRHAVIVRDGARMAVEDAGSRAGTTLAAARIVGRVPLGDDQELGLGPQCRLHVQTLGEGLLRIKGLRGLDRGLEALVGDSPLELQSVFPEAQGLRLMLEGGAARLERLASLPLRVAGRLVGLGCDLLSGDVIEILDEDRNVTSVLEVCA